MIKIIERNAKYHKKGNTRYRVTCYQCKSVFECDDTDFISVIVDQGISDSGVRCPVCGRECSGFYDMDKFVEISD